MLILEFMHPEVLKHQHKNQVNLLYTCVITPKRVTSGGVHLRGLAPDQHSSDERSQRWLLESHWRHWADMADPGLEPQGTDHPRR